MWLRPTLSTSIGIGTVSEVATAIAPQIGAVSELTSGVLADMNGDETPFGPLSAFGVPIADTEIAARVRTSLRPGDSHRERLASQMQIPRPFRRRQAGRSGDGLSRLPAANGAGPARLRSGVVDAGPWRPAHEQGRLAAAERRLHRVLPGRDEPRDDARAALAGVPDRRSGDAFARFWPRPEGAADIPAIHTWSDPATLGAHLAQAEGLSVLLVRGDVVRRYPGMVVTAVRSGPPDALGTPSARSGPTAGAADLRHRGRRDDDGVRLRHLERRARRRRRAPRRPGWFFVFAEHGFRIRFGFDEPPEPNQAIDFNGWDGAVWPAATDCNIPPSCRSLAAMRSAAPLSAPRPARAPRLPNGIAMRPISPASLCRARSGSRYKPTCCCTQRLATDGRPCRRAVRRRRRRAGIRGGAAGLAQRRGARRFLARGRRQPPGARSGAQSRSLRRGLGASANPRCGDCGGGGGAGRP